MTSNKSKHLFSAEEQERIRLAVQQAESGTSGEIATMIVDTSDSYREAEILGSILTSGLFSVIITIAIHHVTIWTYIPLVFVLYLPLFFIFRRFPHLKLAFVGRRRCSEAVKHGALRAFYEKGLYRTKHETGILIYISILERKVWILGDRGIDAKIPPRFWQHFAGQLASGLREGRGCDNLCTVIAGCGEQLARHFPHRPDDKNELPDHLIV